MLSLVSILPSRNVFSTSGHKLLKSKYSFLFLSKFDFFSLFANYFAQDCRVNQKPKIVFKTNKLYYRIWNQSLKVLFLTYVMEFLKQSFIMWILLQFIVVSSGFTKIVEHRGWILMFSETRYCIFKSCQVSTFHCICNWFWARTVGLEGCGRGWGW